MRKVFLLGLFLLLIPFSILAQNITVTGKVIDGNTSETLVGVNVVQAGTTNGTITDFDGKFSISVPSDSKLTFSYIGYVSQTLDVAGKTTIVCTLSTDDKEIEQVVVVGYGTMKKSDVSGSVVSVNAEDMMKRTPANVAQGLQGAAAGVMVSQQDGSPDGKAQVRIRGVATINGSAAPLYVIDGVQVGTDASFLNPADIQSMEVLKDASATAIYGAAGANGVIMITTKHGSKGNTRIDFSADYGVQTVGRTLDVLDADTYAKMMRTAKANDGTGIVNSVWEEKNDGKRKTIDWQDELTDVALRQQYNLSVAGGTDKTQSQFSLGYYNNDGIIVNTNYQRITGRANVKTKVADFIEMGGDINFVHSESHGSNAAINNNGNLSSLRDLAFICPTMDYVDEHGAYISPNVVNEDGTYGGVLHGSLASDGITALLDNPYALQMEQTAKNRNNRVLTSAYMQVNLYEGLTFKSIISYNYETGSTDNAYGNFKRYNYDQNGNLFETNRSSYDPTYNFALNQSQNNTIAIENFLTYAWKNDIMNFSVMAGQSANKYYGSWINGSAKDFTSENIRDLSLTNDPASKSVSGALNLESRNISYFGRLTYSLFDKYILTATVRRDGSSNFGSGNRWGTFPSAALAWRISQEDFLKDNEVISNMKLRLGWGQTGNSGGATNKNATSISLGQKYSFYNTTDATIGAFGGTGTNAGGLKFNLADSNLKWETNEQVNIGIDLGLYDGMFNITADYFVRKSKDLLINRAIRPSSGNTEIYTNYGEIANTGLELSVNWQKRVHDWNFNVTFNGSTLHNEIKKMGDPIYSENTASTGDGSNVGAIGDPAGFHWNRHSICMEGEAVGSYYGYKVIGIVKSQAEADELNAKAIANKHEGYLETGKIGVGDYMYEDVNKDGFISSDDQQILGNGFPAFNYGINVSVAYKNFDLNLYGYGAAGLDLYSYSAMRLSNVFYSDDQTICNLLVDSYNDIWDATTNPNGTLSKLSLKDEACNMRGSDMWVKKADYFKLSNFQIGYTFSKDLIKNLRMTNARVYFGIQNVFCISKYNKYGDPECGQGSVLFTGLDSGRYPQPRTFQFGLNVSF